MEPSIALVTGANKGIGFEVARGLGSAGHVVLLGARNRDRGVAAAHQLVEEGLDVSFVELDITDDASVEAARVRVEDTHGHLDALVNNAAVKLEFHPCPPSSTSLDTVRATYETNVFGTIRMIQAMLPLLLAAPAGRIVNLSSGLGSLTLATTPGSPFAARPLLGYSSAKAAINSITIQLANELSDTPVKVNAADPGYVRSDMTHDDERGRTPAEGAAVVLRLATLDADGPSGGFFDDRGPVPW